MPRKLTFDTILMRLDNQEIILISINKVLLHTCLFKLFYFLNKNKTRIESLWAGYLCLIESTQNNNIKYSYILKAMSIKQKIFGRLKLIFY